MLGLAAIFTSCNINEPIEAPELPAGEYIRLSLSGADGSKEAPSKETRAVWEDPNGKGSLGFKWEAVDISSPQTNRLNLIVSDGANAINSHKSPEGGAFDIALTHTGLAVTPKEADAHYADFETVRYYSTDDLKRARFFYAVAGSAEISTDTKGKRHVCSLDMPSTFTQQQDQDPSFLREQMYMYATADYDGNGTTLRFQHIPATFRFIISNGSDKAVSLQSVSISVQDGAAAGSKATEVIFDWGASEAELSYDDEAHTIVTTMLSDNGVTLEKGHKYTAYSMAMPLASNDAFNGKTLNFSAHLSNGGETLSYLLDGEILAKANGGSIYNWVGGKSYTIRLNIEEGIKATGEVLSNKDITVTSNLEGTYTLKYINEAGEPLANYADICTLEIEQMGTYKDLIDANVAPGEAEAIGIFDAAEVMVGSIAIEGIKADGTGLLYSVGMLSDVHLNTTNAGYSDCFSDFENALRFFSSTDVNAEFTCICGDISEHGTEEEFARYQEIVTADSQTIPVYTTTGNHDCLSVGIDVDLWKKYTGQGLTFEVSRPLANGKTDHFLFLGMSYWNFKRAYLLTELDWVEDKLEEYRNGRCFVITHLFFPERAGNMMHIYPEGNWLKGAQLSRLQAMCDKYKNSIWFSGHSHWRWSLQKFDDIANICRNPESGWSIHIPSCAKPSDSNGDPTDANYSRQEKTALSEGAVINVYENHIDVLGVDFISGKYLPVASYRLDTTLKEVEESTIVRDYLTASNFTVYKGEGQSMTDVADMPGYIDVIFTGKSQGYYMTNSSFTYGYDVTTQGVYITVDDMQCWTGWGTSDQTKVSTIEKVGFYSGSYHLTSTGICYVNETQGVQFQTSSSCEGPYPIKLRMKVRAEFYLKD